MSPTVLAELKAVKRSLNNWVELDPYFGKPLDERAWYFGFLGVSNSALERQDCLLAFRAELPYRRYCESLPEEDGGWSEVDMV